MSSTDSARIVESVIPPESDGLRLDHYLRTRFTYRSRNEWQEAVRRGEIRINGSPARASKLLRSGDRLAFDPGSVEEPEVDTSWSLLYESEEYLAVNKPGQLPAHPSGRFFRNTLWSLLKERYGELHLVNRLDRETSGVTLAAKDPNTAHLLSGLFAGRQSVKKYLAFVHGVFPAELTADGFLSDDRKSPVRKKRRFSLKETFGSESAQTEVRSLGTDGEISLVEALPNTGRLHQIRATLCSLGFPMVGDKLYGLDDTIYLRYIESAMTDADETNLMIRRQALHASELSFFCPFRKKEIIFKAPLPNDLSGLYRRCLGVIV